MGGGSLKDRFGWTGVRLRGVGPARQQPASKFRTHFAGLWDDAGPKPGPGNSKSGLPIHNLKWNREYLELPKIDRDEQNVPAFTSEQIDKLIAESEGDERMLYILLACTGLRIGECLGLDIRHVLNDGRTLNIEQSVNRFGELTGLKTRAAKRPVDVTIEVAAHIREFIKDKGGLLFATANDTPHLVGNLRSRWLQERFPDYGFHSFRRYRVTHLDAVRAHGHLMKLRTGHALSGVTEQYAESLKRNIALRLDEAERVGTGLVLQMLQEFPVKMRR